MSPRLTTLRQDTAKIGSVAAEKLIHLIENPRTTLIQRFVMNGELVAGESVADINGAGEPGDGSKGTRGRFYGFQ